MMIFVLAVALHFILQFIAWSFAPGNTAANLTHSFIGKWWPILSFPTFWILPKNMSNLYFWIISCVNSIIWGLCALLVVFLIRKAQ